MSSCVAVCTEDTALEEVYELIQKCDHKSIVVVDSNAHRVPIGIASEHSILEQIVARGRNPRTLSAGSVMDARIKKVPEDQLLENISIVDLQTLSAMVVVNTDRQIIGLVSRETMRRFESIAPKPRPVTVTVNSAPTTPRPVSEIPAFGWIQ